MTHTAGWSLTQSLNRLLALIRCRDGARLTSEPKDPRPAVPAVPQVCPDRTGLSVRILF